MASGRFGAVAAKLAWLGSGAVASLATPTAAAYRRRTIAWYVVPGVRERLVALIRRRTLRRLMGLCTRCSVRVANKRAGYTP